MSRTASVLSTKSVAPNCSAMSRLRAFVSTAMIRAAPASAAPWMTLSPMPPTPMTTTLAPVGTCARCSTAPTPVSTPQPTSEAAVMGTSAGMGTAWLAFTTVRSEKTDALANEYAGSPRQVNGCGRPPNVDRHIVGRPASQYWQEPQLPSVVRTTWSPSLTVVTPSPTASTTPAPSWPSTTGVGNSVVPVMMGTSLWHRPAAPIRTRTSPGPGSYTDRSSTTW